MDLREFLRSLGSRQAREEFARRCETSLGQLQQVANGHRRAGESLAINIDRESGGKVPCEQLRPDVDWEYLRSSNSRSAA